MTVSLAKINKQNGYPTKKEDFDIYDDNFEIVQDYINNSTSTITSTDRTNLNNMGDTTTLSETVVASIESNSNKIGDLSANGLTEANLATAIKNDRASLSENTQQINSKTQYDLINGSLQIAQRYNASDSTIFTNPSNKYIMDRFRCNGTGTVVPVSGGGCVVTGTINFKYIMEKVDFASLPSTFTLSYGLNGVNNEITVTKANCPVDTNGNATIFNLDVTNVTLNYVHYGKTPFISRLYAEELALCQRYYEIGSTYRGVIGDLFRLDTNVAFKANKRIAPTVVLSSGSTKNKIARTSDSALFNYTIWNVKTDMFGSIDVGTNQTNGVVFSFDSWTADSEIY